MLLKSEKIGVLMVLVVVEDSVRGGDIGRGRTLKLQRNDGGARGTLYIPIRRLPPRKDFIFSDSFHLKLALTIDLP